MTLCHQLQLEFNSYSSRIRTPRSETQKNETSSSGCTSALAATRTGPLFVRRLCVRKSHVNQQNLHSDFNKYDCPFRVESNPIQTVTNPSFSEVSERKQCEWIIHSL